MICFWAKDTGCCWKFWFPIMIEYCFIFVFAILFFWSLAHHCRIRVGTSFCFVDLSQTLRTRIKIGLERFSDLINV